MKKIILLLLTGFSFSFAQAQGPKIGLKLGANYSNIAGDVRHENIYQNKLGFVGGLTTNIPLVGDGFLSIAPEVLFSQKGYQYRDEKFTVNNIDYKRKGDVSYSYLDIPVLLRVNAGGLFFEGGPMGSYLLGIRDNTEEKTEGLVNSNYEKTSVVNKDGLTKFEIGYAAGLGFMTPVGVSLGIRYNGSISKLADESDNDNLTNARHSVYQATIGFNLGGGK